jgi:hypothetical protein
MVENSSEVAPVMKREPVAGANDAGLKEIGLQASGAKMVGQIPGNLVIFLDDGSTLTMTAAAATVTPTGKPDVNGNPGYDVGLSISSVFVPKRG